MLLRLPIGSRSPLYSFLEYRKVDFMRDFNASTPPIILYGKYPCGMMPNILYVCLKQISNQIIQLSTIKLLLRIDIGCVHLFYVRIIVMRYQFQPITICIDIFIKVNRKIYWKWRVIFSFFRICSELQRAIGRDFSNNGAYSVRLQTRGWKK